MPRGYRRKFVAAVRRVRPLYIWSFNGVIWAALLLSYGYQYLDRETKQQQAHYNYQPARDETGPARPAAGKPQSQQYDPKCEAPVNKEDSDLCAQWSAVEAVNEGNWLTRINLWFGAITLLMTSVGTSLLIWTLWETRQTARRELRAYVLVSKVIIDLVAEDSYFGHVELINLGATPALTIEVTCAAWEGPQLAANPRLTGPEPKRQALIKRSLGRDDIAKVPFAIREPGSRVREVGEKSDYFVYGMVAYTDVFNAHHGLSFAYTDPGGAVTTGQEFVPCIVGNAIVSI